MGVLGRLKIKETRRVVNPTYALLTKTLYGEKIMKFHGSLESLMQHLIEEGFSPTEEEQKNTGVSLRFQGGEIVNFWPTTGTINIQGKTNTALKAAIDRLCNSNNHSSIKSLSQSSGQSPKTETIAPATVETKGKVFVVHGHDHIAKDQLELVLHKLGIDHFVLQNTSGNGLTIIEALEKEIGQNAEHVKFGIVLLTPDDMGYPKSEPQNPQPRARQNVVLEMGMLLSAIGRERVAILKKGRLEEPSDVKGILYLGFNEHVKETVPRLVQSLSNAGFKMTPENIANASS